MERRAVVFESFDAADAADAAYWLQKTPEERLEAVEELRRRYFELHHGPAPRLARVLVLA